MYILDTFTRMSLVMTDPETECTVLSTSCSATTVVENRNPQLTEGACVHIVAGVDMNYKPILRQSSTLSGMDIDTRVAIVVASGDG